MRRVVVTGIGAVTPLGVGIRHSWSRLLASECGIVNLSSLQSDCKWDKIPSKVAGVIPTGSRLECKWKTSEWISKIEDGCMAQFTRYAVAATEMALQDSGWRPEKQHDKEKTGVCLGSGIGNIEELYKSSICLENSGYKQISPYFVPRLLINLGAGHISIKYGFQGPNHTVSTACTSGAHAIGDAYRFIAFGDADVMIAGGSESCIHPLALAGFSRSRSLTTANNDKPLSSSRPFDRDRNGFVIAEGAGILVLEELEHAKARGADIYAEVKGYGCSGDSYHITAPRENGSGIFMAMRMALKNAGLPPKSLDYINAHATSTPLGDAAENASITRLMVGEEGLENEREISVSSTKGATGHLLGAAGAVEAIFSILAIKENVMPPTLNLENISDGFKCNYIPFYPQQKTVNTVLSNSIGFGGTNVSLIFTRYT
ncbi:putative 3-oxoacyl- synthase, mitochondrial [Golovinomyces cichoracearum]|uniref:3-oxoacyl-[acyl-carrier-protein] synthase n=1 Tax=Golovinomyces cichoracearum TaxID=62708 RepID=A0A420J4J5_9PEZI|nr:putative 3-oxoacyl- synthase, mitochondrial [Golovinomyces cichoracearum]